VQIVILAGGLGGSKFALGVRRAYPAAQLTVIANTADDITLHGLRVCPDLDTVTYTLAGAINTETGWGLTGESWQAMETLRRYGGPTWFGLGDRDLGTHLFRTHRIEQGAAVEVDAAVAVEHAPPVAGLGR